MHILTQSNALWPVSLLKPFSSPVQTLTTQTRSPCKHTHTPPYTWEFVFGFKLQLLSVCPSHTLLLCSRHVTYSPSGSEHFLQNISASKGITFFKMLLFQVWILGFRGDFKATYLHWASLHWSVKCDSKWDFVFWRVWPWHSRAPARLRASDLHATVGLPRPSSSLTARLNTPHADLLFFAQHRLPKKWLREVTPCFSQRQACRPTLVQFWCNRSQYLSHCCKNVNCWAQKEPMPRFLCQTFDKIE